MSKTAILVDGGFYRKRSRTLWGFKEPQEAADGLMHYVRGHLKEHHIRHDLYRIFYYDCPPVDKQVYHPLLQTTINLKNNEEYLWMESFLGILKSTRKVALRLGKLDDNNTTYGLKYQTTKQLCSKSKSVDDLTELDFQYNFRQKGVDMKLGIDIASLAYKHQVDQIILIAGDSDFVPAAKLARREGIDFVLDPMELSIKPDLEEHIDGKRSLGNPYTSYRTKTT